MIRPKPNVEQKKPPEKCDFKLLNATPKVASGKRKLPPPKPATTMKPTVKKKAGGFTRFTPHPCYEVVSGLALF